MTFQVATPTISDKIRVQVRDFDRGLTDTVVATHFLSFSDLQDKRNGINWSTERWLNLYGTPPGVSARGGLTKKAKLAEKMNQGFVEGSAFRGRILMSATVTQAQNPKTGVSKVSPVAPPKDVKFKLRFDLYEITDLPHNDSVSVEVTCGVYKLKSKKVSVKNGAATWYEAFPDLETPFPRDRTQIPDIFINVFKRGMLVKERIGFIRVPASSVTSKAGPMWSMIQPDVFTDEKSPSIMGFLQYRLQFGQHEEFSKREEFKKPPMKKMQLLAHMYQAADLPAGDSDGSSDPYVFVRCGRFKAKSRIIKKTLYPQWYETLVLPIEIPTDLNIAPDIQIIAMDWDQFSGDDYLCRTAVPLRTVTSQMPARPQWYDLYVKDPQFTSGKVLCSFQLLDENTQANPPSLIPETRDCILEVNCIGVRQMIPYLLLPVKEPFVQFSCGETIAKTTISKMPNGPNANFLATINMDVKIPADPMFAPPIDIKVYDDRTIIKALVGTRSIPTTPFVPWQSKEEGMQEILMLQDEHAHRVDQILGANPNEPAPTGDNLQIVTEEPSFDNTEECAKNIGAQFEGHRTLPEVQESTVEGAEDTEPDDEEKRKTTQNELELDMSDPPFGTYPLFRAKNRKGRKEQFQVGRIKVKFRIIEKSKLAQAEPPIDLVKLYSPTPYVVRIYCLEGFQLVPKDSDGKNNPYIKVSDGKQKIKDVQTAKQGTNRPLFYKCYEIQSVFPQQSQYTVSVIDWDKVGNDELIGETKIDLENRIYSREWKALDNKPMEWRTLWHKSSQSPQGQLKMWVDIMPPDVAAKTPQEKIQPPLPVAFELRVVIWETQDVIFKDKDMSDIFVTGQMEGGSKPQATDTHWRSEDGRGYFNWRMKFPITWPGSNPRFKLQIWDKDVLSPDDAIGEAIINLKGLIKRGWAKKSRQLLDQQYVALTHPKASGCTGKVLVSFDLLTAEEASRKPAGFGRKEPNDNPFLEEPHRPETSFNPLRVDKYIEHVAIGQNKAKIIGAGVCIIIVLIIIIVIIIALIVRFVSG